MTNSQAKLPNNSPALGRNDEAHGCYTELCALATTGTLMDSEWKLLKSHVLKCPDCARAMQEFREIARTGMPLLIPDSHSEGDNAQEAWSPAKAREELLARVGKGHESGWQESASGAQTQIRNTWWHQPRMSYARQALVLAAGFLLAAGVTDSIYRYGWKQGAEVSHTLVADPGPLRKQISALQQEKESLVASLQVKDLKIESLSMQLVRASAEFTSLKTLQKQNESDLNRQASELTEALTQKNAAAAERDAVARKLEGAESTVASLKVSLDHLRQERAADLIQTASLETQIEDLNAHLKQHEESNVSDAQLLASDRDIRELMGARELYIADVFDVDPDSHTQKPYGRVFYTRGKTLIFYAFDLDKQRGVRNASTYQAWGRRGPHDNRPMNMGIFYLDSDANRRWVLKFDNPEALARIDTVFVTVEPKGGSQEPRGKPLLLASLKSQPNHP